MRTATFVCSLLRFRGRPSTVARRRSRGPGPDTGSDTAPEPTSYMVTGICPVLCLIRLTSRRLRFAAVVFEAPTCAAHSGVGRRADSETDADNTARNEGRKGKRNVEVECRAERTRAAHALLSATFEIRIQLCAVRLLRGCCCSRRTMLQIVGGYTSVQLNYIRS